MEDTKAKILDYFQDLYSRTGWPYLYEAELTTEFGEYTREAIHSLCREGILCPRDGIKGILYQYIINENIREKVKDHYLQTLKTKWQIF